MSETREERENCLPRGVRDTHRPFPILPLTRFEQLLDNFCMGSLRCKLTFQRTTVKRMCIKTLPPVLVIQLKRFGYDWEAGRALKFDDHFEVIRAF